MAFGGAFSELANRILTAAKKGGLNSKELKKLSNLLDRTKTRNTVLARGILSALNAGGASQKDVARFGQLLMGAEDRILSDKNPFTDPERKEMNSIFKRAYLSAKTVNWFSSQIDELVAEEINEFISGARGLEAAVPSRKSSRLDVPIKKIRVEDESEPETRRKIRI